MRLPKSQPVPTLKDSRAIMSLRAFLTAMPKVELHVHLEGAMPPETLLHLVQKYGLDLPVRTLDDVRRWFTFRDFPHFVTVYVAISGALRTLDDLERLAGDFLRGQAAQNIRYTEFTYTPYTHTRLKGWSIQEQHAALNRARRRARDELGIEARMIFDIAREVTPAEGRITAEAVIDRFQTDDHGLAGLGLGGYEAANPADKFADSFALARAVGVPLILHAGETAGPESIRRALDLGARRIGHGVRAVEDPALLSELRQRQIALEVCPTSNIRLGIYPSLAEHPLPHLLHAGLIVTLGSDDPPLFDTTLTEEYLRTAEAFGFGAQTYIDMVRAGIAVSTLPADAQTTLWNQFEAEIDGLRARYAV